MTYYSNAVAVFFGVVVAIFVIDMFIRKHRERRGSPSAQTLSQLQADVSLSPVERYRLMIDAETAAGAGGDWLERSFSTLGTVALVAALVTAGVQIAQNADLKAESERADREVKFLRAQSSRAEALVAPLSQILVDDFEQRGVAVRGVGRELVLYQLDRWATDPAASPETLLRAFKAAAIVGDMATANAIANRLGRDLSRVNPAERRTATEYLWTVGFGAQAFDRLNATLSSPGTIAREDLVFTYALGRLVGAVSETEAVAQVAHRLELPQADAARRISEVAARLRRNRERYVDAARADGSTLSNDPAVDRVR